MTKIYQQSEADSNESKKIESSCKALKFMVVLEGKMKSRWVEIKKRGLKIVDFMLILEY